MELQPPDEVPDWMDADSSISSDGLHTKGVVVVIFTETATLAERQAALDSVSGTVVGGDRLSSGDGYFYFQVPDSGDAVQLREAVDKLANLPQVENASLDYRIAAPLYLKPNDGAGWRTADWTTTPISAAGSNWALEAIAAPFAWGCSTGSTDTKVSVIDRGFDATELTANVASGSTLFGVEPGVTLRHGTTVANLVAARGNDSIGITGVMWRAGLRLVDYRLQRFSRIATLIEREGAAGSSIVNVSYGIDWPAIIRTSPHFDPRLFPDSARMIVSQTINMMRPALERSFHGGRLPLIVLAAGNDTIDASFGLGPLRDIFPHNILTVGASNYVHGRASFTDYGSYVDVYAPGEGITSYANNSGTIALVSVQGTSFAAPLVTGVAGLLRSFDPTLTPDSLRALIIEGATRGRQHVVPTTLDTGYVVNAYESLKLAAQRPHAPLCGNKVWIEDRTVLAERGNTIEVLTALNPSWYGAYLNVKHGGHRFEVDYGHAFVYSGTAGTWDHVEDGGDPSSLDGAMFSSYNGSSHDGDVYVGAQTMDDLDAHEKTIVVTVYDSAGSRDVATMHFPYSVPGLQCGRKQGSPIEGDWTLNGGFTITGGYVCDDSTAAGSWTEVAVIGSYPFISPDGETALIPVDTWANSATAGNTFVVCDSTTNYDTNGLPLDVCLSSTITRTLARTDVYRIPLHGPVPTDLEHHPAWTIANRGIYWMALSEDNREFAAGFETMSNSITGGTGTGTGFTQSTAAMNCMNEYRSSFGDTLQIGTLLRGTSSNSPTGSNACWVDAGSGISSIRVAPSPGFSRQLSPGSNRLRGISINSGRHMLPGNKIRVPQAHRTLLPFTGSYVVPGGLWSFDERGHAHIQAPKWQGRPASRRPTRSTTR